MGANSIIATLLTRGIKLSVSGDKLSINYSGQLSNELRTYLKKNKVELIKSIQNNYTNTAHQRLASLANELDHPLPDLLDWYQSPADMETLGSISIDETRKAVSFYVNNLDINRYEGYVPIGYRPGKPTEKAWVMCINCQHFTPDDIAGGGGAGIGDCAEGVAASPPCYPKSERNCAGYQPLT